MRRMIIWGAAVWMSFPPHARAQNGDCNANGVLDATDISNGTTPDCNGNGVPDVCESSFAVDQTAAAPGAPLGLAAADFNADGLLDLTYVDRSADAAVVLLGDGTGQFTVHSFGVGDLPVWLAVADLNGDTRPDLAVVNAASNDVTILVNTGLGGAPLLAHAATIQVGLTPTYIIAANLDADGDLDLVVTEEGFQSIRKLINDGQAVFTSAGDQQVGIGPIAIASADFDGDGRSDLAVANETSNNLSILLSGPNVPPPTVANFGSPVALTAGDFDGDTRPDLAVANFTASTILILRNAAGDGSFTPGDSLTDAVNPSYLIAADMNGDSRLDLLASDASGMLLFLGRGDGTFALTQRGAVGAGINSFVFAALSGPAAQVAALDANAQQVLLLRSDGPACSQPPPAPPAGCGGAGCGAGGAGIVPLTMTGLFLMRLGGTGRAAAPRGRRRRDGKAAS